MTGIQIVLVLAALVWLARFLSRLRSRGVARLAAVAAALGAIALVLVPTLSVRLAHFFGVSRGVDLVIYLAFVALGFLWLHQAARLRDLERTVVEMARALALAGARVPEDRDEPRRAPGLDDGSTDLPPHRP